jgi:hypothetical protein
MKGHGVSLQPAPTCLSTEQGRKIIEAGASEAYSQKHFTVITDREHETKGIDPELALRFLIQRMDEVQMPGQGKGRTPGPG